MTDQRKSAKPTENPAVFAAELSVTAMMAVVNVLASQNAFLVARVAELEEKLGLPSIRPDDAGVRSAESEARYQRLLPDAERVHKTTLDKARDASSEVIRNFRKSSVGGE